jgi:hypothetical protein
MKKILAIFVYVVFLLFTAALCEAAIKSGSICSIGVASLVSVGLYFLLDKISETLC